MKILMLSTDVNILKEGSAVRERMVSYGAICGELHIVIPTYNLQPTTYDKKIKIAENVFVYPTYSKNKFFSRIDLISIGKKISADLVTTQDPFETGLAGWIISRKTGAKLELQIHTDFLSPYFGGESFLNKIRVSVAKFLLPKADGIRVVSQRIVDSLKAKSYKLRTVPTVLPVFVDIEKIRKAEPKINLHQKYPKFDFIALMVSRLTSEKNIGLAIEAMRGMVDKQPKAGLIIVGSGPEESNLKFKTKNLKLSNNIIFEGWQSDTISYYKTADSLINTSNYEGFGMTLVEAVASDCPVISTDVGIVGSILRDGEEVLACPVGDVNCLRDEIGHLADYPARRKELALRGQTAIQTLNITKSEYLSRLRSIWEKLSLRA